MTIIKMIDTYTGYISIDEADNTFIDRTFNESTGNLQATQGDFETTLFKWLIFDNLFNTETNAYSKLHQIQLISNLESYNINHRLTNLLTHSYLTSNNFTANNNNLNIEIDMETPIIIKSYDLYSTLDNTYAFPTDWILLGSNSNNLQSAMWTSIKEETGVTWSDVPLKSIDTQNSTPYRFYKIEITGVNDANKQLLLYMLKFC